MGQVTSDFDDTVPHSDLKAINVVATKFGLLICMRCYHAYVPHQMLHHIKRTHYSRSKRGLKVNPVFEPCPVDLNTYEPTLLAAADVCGIGAAFPAQPSWLPRPIPCLKVCKGFRCTVCDYACESQQSMGHHSRTAKDHPTPSRRRGEHFYEPCSVQRFNTQTTYFAIRPQNTPSSRTTPLTAEDHIEAQFASLAAQGRGSDMPHDTRDASGWVESTGWHRLVRPYDVAELRKTVAGPGKDEFGTPSGALETLSDALETYQRDGLALAADVEEIVLQKINTVTVDPEK